MDYSTRMEAQLFYNALYAEYREEKRILKMWYRLHSHTKEQRRAQRQHINELEIACCQACLYLMELRKPNEVNDHE